MHARLVSAHRCREKDSRRPARRIPEFTIRQPGGPIASGLVARGIKVEAASHFEETVRMATGSAGGVVRVAPEADQVNWRGPGGPGGPGGQRFAQAWAAVARHRRVPSTWRAVTAPAAANAGS